MTNAKLTELCITLDAQRGHVARVREQIAELEQQIIDEFVARKIAVFDFIPSERRALVDQPVTTKLGVDAFYTAARAASCSVDDINEAISTSVSITRARRLLGDQRLAEVATTEPGNYRVRITSARGASK